MIPRAEAKQVGEFWIYPLILPDKKLHQADRMSLPSKRWGFSLDMIDTTDTVSSTTAALVSKTLFLHLRIIQRLNPR